MPYFKRPADTAPAMDAVLKQPDYHVHMAEIAEVWPAQVENRVPPDAAGDGDCGTAPVARPSQNVTVDGSGGGGGNILSMTGSSGAMIVAGRT